MDDELLAVLSDEVEHSDVSELAVELDHDDLDDSVLEDWLEGVLLDALDRLDTLLTELMLEGVLEDRLDALCDEALEGVLLDRLEGLLAVLRLLGELSVESVELAEVGLWLDCVETDDRELTELALEGVLLDRLDGDWLDGVLLVSDRLEGVLLDSLDAD